MKKTIALTIATIVISLTFVSLAQAITDYEVYRYYGKDLPKRRYWYGETTGWNYGDQYGLWAKRAKAVSKSRYLQYGDRPYRIDKICATIRMYIRSGGTWKTVKQTGYYKDKWNRCYWNHYGRTAYAQNTYYPYYYTLAQGVSYFKRGSKVKRIYTEVKW